MTRSVASPGASQQRRLADKARHLFDPLEETVSVIARGVIVTGDLTIGEDLRVDGVIQGDLTVDGFCYVAAGGRVDGRVRARHLILSGEIHGEITLTGRAEIRCGARVLGDLAAKSVDLSEEALFQGKVLGDTVSRIYSAQRDIPRSDRS